MTGIVMLIAWICGLIQGLVIHAFYTLDGGDEDETNSQ
jgi:hypothetical protein